TPAPIPTYPIATVTTNDAQGVADSLNTYCKVVGVVVGPDYDGNNGYSFFMYDQTGGINVFNFNDVGTYQVAEGDSLRVIGSIAQFNGLTEIVPDSIVVLSQGNPIVAPSIETTLDESTESEFIQLNGVSIIDTTGWPSANFGNFDILVGADTFTLRIDSDTDIPANWPNAPAGTFNVVGLGSQFDNIGGNNTPPYNDGYQILPRYFTDIDTTSIPVYPISLVSTEDGQGVADSLGTYCKLIGTVVGIDYDGNNGINFFMYDQTGGINVFSFTDVGTYQVTEGDSIRVIGEIDQFNGLIEIVPDSIVVLATGVTIKQPTVVTALGESTESEFIKLEDVEIIDTTGWPSANFGNFDILVGTDTFTLRIDSDTDIPANWPNAPVGTFDVTGLGSQFDNIGGNNTPPYNDRYQILPRFFTDIDTSSTPPAPSLFINEVMADNQGFISDEHNDANDDWVEIYNPNAMDVDVADMYITDDITNPTKYRFPTGSNATVIPANGYLIVWCDNQQTQAGPLHTNFVLSETNGGTVRLTHVDGTTLIDEITFNALATNESFGRESDGATNFTTFVAGSTMEPTPGSANGVVGIELLNDNNTSFQAYPNPVDGSEVFFNQMANVVVFNVVGQVVTQARQVNQLSVDGWESGIYLVRTEQGETIRLIVK
ncbi:MAG: lamin tail domain-containing protein, partial [Salibacteraceae bacterium]